MQQFSRIGFTFVNALRSCKDVRKIGDDVRQKLEVGSRVSVVRKITDDDVTNFAKLTGDYNPIHTEKKIVHGALLNGFLSGVLGTRLPGPGTIVVEQRLHYTKPCYAGDTVEITVEVLSVRKIIRCAYRLVANSERTVLEGEGRFILTKVNDESKTTN